MDSGDNELVKLMQMQIEELKNMHKDDKEQIASLTALLKDRGVDNTEKYMLQMQEQQKMMFDILRT